MSRIFLSHEKVLPARKQASFSLLLGEQMVKTLDNHGLATNGGFDEFSVDEHPNQVLLEELSFLKVMRIKTMNKQRFNKIA